MKRIQVFNYQEKNKTGNVLNQDLVTECQVLETLKNQSRMNAEDINHAINHIKENNEQLFVELENGNKIFLSYTLSTLH